MAAEPMDFAAFYASAKDDCFRAVLASTGGDRHATEDLVAEAFARAWASWRKVSRHPQPRAWVVRTALNTRVSWWRRQRREVALGPADGASLAGPDASPVDHELLTAVLRLPTFSKQNGEIILRERERWDRPNGREKALVVDLRGNGAALVEILTRCHQLAAERRHRAQ